MTKMAKCASCAALEEKGYVVAGDWTAEIRCGECNKVLFEGPSWPDPHLRWIRIGFAQKAPAAAPTTPFLSLEAVAKSTLDCITLSADAAEGWLSVAHPVQFVRAAEPDPDVLYYESHKMEEFARPNPGALEDAIRIVRVHKSCAGLCPAILSYETATKLLDLLTAAQDEAKRLNRERDAARAEVAAQESEVRGLRANLAAALARAEKAERNAEAHAVGREVLRNTVQTLAQERDAAVARAEKLSDTLCANNTEAAGIRIERDALRASLAAAQEREGKMRAALAELVACRDLKQSLDGASGTMADLTEYERRKPLALDAARLALSQPAPAVPEAAPRPGEVEAVKKLADLARALAECSEFDDKEERADVFSQIAALERAALSAPAKEGK